MSYTAQSSVMMLVQYTLLNGSELHTAPVSDYWYNLTKSVSILSVFGSKYNISSKSSLKFLLPYRLIAFKIVWDKKKCVTYNLKTSKTIGVTVL